MTPTLDFVINIEGGRIAGLGHDVLDIRRVETLMERYGERFSGKYFTEGEQAFCNQREGAARMAAYAKRFAAKEACAKALGSGFRNGIKTTDIEILSKKTGQPYILLHNAALQEFWKLTEENGSIHLSISDEYPYATAIVVIERI